MKVKMITIYIVIRIQVTVVDHIEYMTHCRTMSS